MKTRIKAIREALKLSQQEFAEKTCVKQAAISKYERGEVKPTTEFYSKLVSIFHIDINWLLNGEGTMFRASTRDATEEAMVKQDDDEHLMEKINELTNALPKLSKKDFLRNYHQIMADIYKDQVPKVNKSPKD